MYTRKIQVTVASGQNVEKIIATNAHISLKNPNDQTRSVQPAI